MDREAASLNRRAGMLENAPDLPPNQPIEMALGDLAPGTESYSMVSTWSGNGVCTQSVEITSPCQWQAARRVAQLPQLRLGAGLHVCDQDTHIARADAPARHIPGTHGTTPYGGLIREAGWQR